jgi:hypothetical protein
VLNLRIHTVWMTGEGPYSFLLIRLFYTVKDFRWKRRHRNFPDNSNSHLAWPPNILPRFELQHLGEFSSFIWSYADPFSNSRLGTPYWHLTLLLRRGLRQDEKHRLHKFTSHALRFAFVR